MPVPMIAPMPSIVRSKVFIVRFSGVAEAVSSSTVFLRSSFDAMCVCFLDGLLFVGCGAWRWACVARGAIRYIRKDCRTLYKR